MNYYCTVSLSDHTMANDESHNMLWKDVQLVKQEEDTFPIYSNNIHDDISSGRFSIFENWDLDMVNDANILLLDDPYSLQMLPESSFIPDYSSLPSLDPINAYFGFEEYVYQLDHHLPPFHNSNDVVMNNNNVVMCQDLQQNQMPLVCSHETLAVPDECVWPDKVEDNNNNIHGEISRRVGAKRSRSSVEDIDNYSKAITLSREAISEYFYMPITQAAKEMNIGLTLLKKRCREVGIRRWPHRKLMSLQTLINNVQEMGDGMQEKKKSKVVIEMLENEMKLMEQVPDRELGENTKKLRQACFKANYKKRKLISPHLLCSSSSSSSSSSLLLLTVPDSLPPATATAASAGVDDQICPSSLINYYNSSYV